MQVDIIVSRDLDSRFSERESFAVSAWLDTDEPIHSMRDHRMHGTTMLGEEIEKKDFVSFFFTYALRAYSISINLDFMC